MFNKIMERIKKANPKAYGYLLKKDPKTWSRAYFRIGQNCESVENGFSECFNYVVLSVGNKPLITMLEAMRVIVLERMNIMRKFSDRWTDDICPDIQKRLEATKYQHRFWRVIPTGGNLFEVRNVSEAFGVDEQNQTCSCRLWKLSVGGMTFWPDCSDMSRVLPPKPKSMPNRPRKRRIMAAHENKNPNKVSKAGVTMTCTNCH